MCGTRRAERCCTGRRSAAGRDAAALLLDIEAEVDARDGKGNTALHHAARRGASDLAALLISSGADPDARTPDLGVTPLHLASRHGHLETMRVLMRNGASPLEVSRLSGTPLHWAAEHGRLDAVRVLLRHGAPASIPDDHGLSAAERARAAGHQGVADLLERTDPREVASPLPSPPALARTSTATDCALPERLHGASRTVLLHYVEGALPIAEFRRLFSLPNSEYLELGACLSAPHERG